VLPAFGVFSQIIPTFARKPLFGYASMSMHGLDRLLSSSFGRITCTPLACRWPANCFHVRHHADRVRPA